VLRLARKRILLRARPDRAGIADGHADTPKRQALEARGKLAISHFMNTETPIRSSVDLGAVIREQRKRLALKQLDLAGLGDTGNRFIVDVENGKPTVQLQKVLDLMELLGLEVVVRAKASRSAPPR
jgi:y4mF family transcriptional regulator